MPNSNDLSLDPLFHTLAESSGELVCLTDAGRIAYINPTGAGMLGAASPDSCLNHPFNRFIHPDYAELYHLLADEPEAAPILLITLDSRTVHVKLHVRPAPHELRGGGQL